MMDILNLFFNWVKMNFAKEALLTSVSLVLAVFISYIIHLLLWTKEERSDIHTSLIEYDLDYIEYRIFLCIIILAMIYGIRFVERMFNIVLLKKEPKA